VARSTVGIVDYLTFFLDIVDIAIYFCATADNVTFGIGSVFVDIYGYIFIFRMLFDQGF
jgi:hypothetical protein